jgi:hypothetical protein
VVRAHDPVACVQPSESAVPRWMQRSLTACSCHSSPRQTTTGSPRSFVPNGVSPSSAANATGCQQLRNACMSGTAEGGSRRSRSCGSEDTRRRPGTVLGTVRLGGILDQSTTF